MYLKRKLCIVVNECSYEIGRISVMIFREIKMVPPDLYGAPCIRAGVVFIHYLFCLGLYLLVFKGWGCIQEWGCIQADTVLNCVIELSRLNCLKMASIHSLKSKKVSELCGKTHLFHKLIWTTNINCS